eukprot:gene15498-11035_t
MEDQVVVSPGWLAAQLDGGGDALQDLIVLDCFTEISDIPTEPELGCIKGTIPVEMSSFSNYFPPFPYKEPLKYGMCNCIDAGSLPTALAAIGVTADSRVVCYSSTSSGKSNRGPVAAARMVWTLTLAGTKAACLLDGGLDGWKEVGNPVETQWRKPHLAATVETAAARMAATAGAGATSCSTDAYPRQHVLATSAEIEVYVATILRRRPRTYIGGKLWAQKGEHYLLDVDVLRKGFATAGLCGDDGARVIMYCGSGWRSAYAWLLARHCGWKNVASYDGGWLEWSTLHPSAAQHPFETGDPSDRSSALAVHA